MMVQKCWAKVLGGCDSISREHVISRAVIQGNRDGRMFSEGLKRIPSGPMGIEAMTAKILCRAHNSKLADLDSEAGKLMDYVELANRNKHNRDLTLDGSLIERWLVKTFMNSLAAGWIDQDRKWLPDESVVASVFGLASVPADCGFYMVSSSNDRLSGPRQFEFTPLKAHMEEGKQTFAGAFVTFAGMKMLISLQSGLVDLLKKFPSAVSDGLRTDQLSYAHRPQAIVMTDEHGVENRILLQWPAVAGRST